MSKRSRGHKQPRDKLAPRGQISYHVAFKFTLTDSHLVDDFEFHSGPKFRSDGLPDFRVEILRNRSGAGETFHEIVLPVLLFALDGWKKLKTRGY